VDLVLEHVEAWPGRTLGVVALGLGQAEAIEMELQERLRDQPELAARLEVQTDEPLFVKNLENVQGDERDEIILSIGYGPREPGGPVPLRFGPINQEGGERRLNVAVTRARYRTTVVCSFRPEALLRATETLRPGPRYLHEYLVYAQRGGRFTELPDTDPTKAPESDFEEAVRDALEARGYQVDSQVGQSGHRIDLAVRDPDQPTRYLLAIECDGASYHSSPAVRDRDRLRQEQLEALGWRFHRIWSTDWIRDPTRALDHAIRAIEQARRDRNDGSAATHGSA
jgi:very-short-patch-repair endonuclease